jgi:UDP-glucuronate 4-epimerase
MSILVTGSAGFIGSHLARALLSEGREVVGIDNFNDYYDPALKQARTALLEDFDGYRGYEMDIADRTALLELMRREKVDLVCHLAAQAGVRYSIDHPFAYQHSNLDGFLSVLEACRHAGKPRLVYASSSSVYGGNSKVPFGETDPVDHPVSLYAATKKANELMAHTYSHLYGMQTVGLRFFTVYGPWGRPDMAYWLFTEAMLAGRPIKVFNYGDMRRDFTYIDDIIAGVRASLFSGQLDRCELINLGNSSPENLMEMIAVIGSALGIEPEMEMLPMQPGDVETTYADIARARAKLGYDPATPITEGLPRFVEWYRDYRGLKPR